MSELVDCINNLSAEDIIRQIAKTANGTPFYLQTLGLAGFCDEYQRIYNDLEGSGTPPGDVVAAEQNTMVCGLVDDGVWAKLDIFYLFAQTTNAGGEALINWVTTGFHNATIPVGPIAFTALEGFTGDGTASDYISANYNPTTDAINYAQDNASAGCYIRTNVNENKNDFGLFAAIGPFLKARAAGNSQSRINSNGSNSDANADSRGMWILSRLNATEEHKYKNKVDDVLVTVSVGIPNVDMFILAANNGAGGAHSPSTKQFSMFFMGSGFTQTDVNNMTDRFETYMDSNGKGVIP